MSLTTDDVQQFVQAARTFERIAKDLESVGGSRSNTATISVNAGGAGVWLASTCCLVMLAMTVMGGFWISREFNRIDSVFNDLNDKDSVQDAYINKLRSEHQREPKP